MNKLDEAKSILENSWCRGDYKVVDEDGVARFCAVGALGEAFNTSYIEAEKSLEIEILADVIRENYEQKFAEAYPDSNIEHFDPADWVIGLNDTVAENKDEIIAMFEKASVKFDEVAHAN